MIVLGGVLGWLTMAWILIMSGDMLAQVLDDPSNPPLSYFFYLALLHLLSGLVGGWVATLISRRAPLPSLSVLGGLTLVLGLYNLLVSLDALPIFSHLSNLAMSLMGVYIARFGASKPTN